MKYLTLVNKDNPFNEKYLKKINLVNIKDVNNKNILVEEETYKAYLKLKKRLLKDGIEIGISSAFRSVEYQENIYSEFKEKYGQEYTVEHVAIPRFSEHHTGLAIDINIKVDGKYPASNKELEEQKDKYLILPKYLKNYGFILRYPLGKEKITGYKYEPWHLRYVGKPVSKIISDNNYTLEEYLTNYSGILVINKPKDMTSFAVVRKVSNILGIKKIGHTGTLDPLATGVMVLTIGKATKIEELIASTDKEYVAGALLGIKTDTLDITGKIEASKIVPDNIDIEKALNSFKGTYMQEVPIYSAIKVKGEKLYSYARKNKKVELPKREVTIKDITLLNTDRNTFTFKALVSKGCYIRSLIRDIAERLNTYGVMTNLERTKQNNFTINDCNSLEDVEKGKFKLYKVEDVLDYPKIVINDKLYKKISNGVKIENTYNIKDKVIFLDKYDNIIGIYQKEGKYLKTWKNFT